MPYQVQGGYGLRHIGGSGDQVNVVGAFFLQPEENVCQLPDGQFFSESLLADGIILAVAAAQGTAAEKYGPAAKAPADTWLLPMVELGLGSPDGNSTAAESGSVFPVDATAVGAKPATVQSAFPQDVIAFLPGLIHRIPILSRFSEVYHRNKKRATGRNLSLPVGRQQGANKILSWKEKELEIVGRLLYNHPIRKKK